MASALVGTIALPDGAVVRGRGLDRPAPDGPLPAYGLYLGSARLRTKHDATLTWPHDWIRWPDFRLPLDWADARGKILGLHSRALAGDPVEVACYGGVGRTGTVLACLATCAGLPPREAIAWVRQHHSRRAVEMRWQEWWVAWFSGKLP
ncbi:protein tyrosine phosphatase [Amycolatopsis sp. FDAARGOS 1241]|uniref:protein-tyrosine phosphatase family protein n=1 Tax=Amycolatopsis sp. FDAARGOS 1241 TaxID=2778070 RepID=UPI001952027C|nr:protein tyrosine phosphatase [Amycolatopsis sp. FDAARGOS 1241]QRP45227.1 protein tyrosine phosphatase [Amycolatopsis sp. FDAARGOS 1241]